MAGLSSKVWLCFDTLRRYNGIYLAPSDDRLRRRVRKLRPLFKTWLGLSLTPKELTDINPGKMARFDRIYRVAKESVPTLDALNLPELSYTTAESCATIIVHTMGDATPDKRVLGRLLVSFLYLEQRRVPENVLDEILDILLKRHPRLVQTVIDMLARIGW